MPALANLSLPVDYKHSKIQHYRKKRQLLRTETTINGGDDYGSGRRL